jgi:hypothetical protein
VSVAFPTVPSAAITQEFNHPNPKYYGGDGKHKGIDYGVMTGTPVYACMNGLVESASVANGGYGRHVVIKHGDGSRSFYAHLIVYSVVAGQPVEAGQQIGLSGGDPNDKIGGDGNSTGAHLHWEIRPAGAKSDQDAVDPEKYCVSFLPAGRAAKCVSSVGLNVRSGPDTNAQILYTMPIGQVVQVTDQAKGWARLRALRPEYCSVGYLEFEDLVPPVVSLSAAEKVERMWKAHPDLW